MPTDKFKTLVKLLQKLPGVGPRQASRFVIALLEKPDVDLIDLGQAILSLKKDISFCQTCFNISDNHLCSVCSSPKRDQTKILVVEKVTDLDSIEKTGLYTGLYHVLGGAINPLEGLNYDTLRFKELLARTNQLASKSGKVELIIATNPNTAGEATALYLRDLFKDRNDIALTRLGRGLSSGSHLEYIDELTLKHALEYRK